MNTAIVIGAIAAGFVVGLVVGLVGGIRAGFSGGMEEQGHMVTFWREKYVNESWAPNRAKAEEHLAKVSAEAGEDTD